MEKLPVTQWDTKFYHMVDTERISLASSQSLQKPSSYYKPKNDCGKVAIETMRQNFIIYHMPVKG